MKKIITLIIIFISSFSYGNEFCEELVGESYQGAVHLIPHGQTYKIIGSEKVAVHSAPHSKCLYEKKIFLIGSERVQVYTEYNGFLSIIYFKNDGSTVEGWVRKENLSRTNESVSP